MLVCNWQRFQYNSLVNVFWCCHSARVWSEWGPCSQTCGVSERTRVRPACIPTVGRPACPEDQLVSTVETSVCTLPLCPRMLLLRYFHRFLLFLVQLAVRLPPPVLCPMTAVTRYTTTAVTMSTSTKPSTMLSTTRMPRLINSYTKFQNYWIQKTVARTFIEAQKFRRCSLLSKSWNWLKS